MKSKILKIINILFILLILLSIKTYAVTYSSTDCTVKSEGTITIIVKASENVKNYDITLTSYTGLTFVSASATDAAVNPSTGAISYATLGTGVTTLATYTFKAPKVTEDTTYNVVFDINGTANTAKVVVEAETPPEQEKPDNTETPSTGTTTPETPTTPTEPETPSTPQEPEKPETPTVTEPKFTDVNKKMYATRDCNLRASWSTSSAATSVKEGTELKVTGTSTEKVNDYVWYRVSYNGQTKYIASYLLTSTKPEEEKKSDNAYLKSLIVDGQELLPTFNKETTSYTMQVSNDVTELNIKAEAEDEKATVEMQGNKNLKEGENTVTISVNAEDNTIKIYEITVTKAEKTALGLKTLIIKDTDIENKFKTDVYNYEIDIEDVTKLDIEAVANDEKAIVEILGNEDLQDGENTITIIVSSENGEEKVTYQIKANKGVVQSTQTVEQEQQPKQQISSKIYLYIALGAVLLIALIIVIVYVIEHRNQEDEYEYSDNFEGFPEELPEQLPQRQEEKLSFNEELDVEETQPVDTVTDTYQGEYEEEEYSEETIDEEAKIEERRAKIDYFLDDAEDDEGPRRRRGKHF